MEPSFANADKSVNNIQGSLISGKKQTAMKNSRLDLSNSQLKWETIFKQILIAMSVILILIIVTGYIIVIPSYHRRRLSHSVIAKIVTELPLMKSLAIIGIRKKSVSFLSMAFASKRSQLAVNNITST